MTLKDATTIKILKSIQAHRDRDNPRFTSERVAISRCFVLTNDSVSEGAREITGENDRSESYVGGNEKEKRAMRRALARGIIARSSFRKIIANTDES